MEKQELLSKIDEIEKQLEELKNQVNSIEFEGIKKCVRQKPEYEEKYFFVDSSIDYQFWEETKTDLFRFNTGNCFKTEQEAEDYKENLLTKQALKDLALELNNGVEIDWKNEEQPKFYIYYNYDRNLLSSHWYYVVKTQDVFCLNNEFLTIAKDRIGEEKLTKLIKSGI